MSNEIAKVYQTSVSGVVAAIALLEGGGYEVKIAGIPKGTTMSPDKVDEMVRTGLLAVGVAGIDMINLNHFSEWELVQQDLFDPESDK